MTGESPIDDGWTATVERLGGAARLEKEAREAGAFARSRAVKDAVSLLRLSLAYCLGAMGLRLTAAWAEALGVASLSNVALLKRLRKMAPWLELIVARLIAAQAAGMAAGMAAECRATEIGRAAGRRIRLVDATVVAKASRTEREAGGVWRIHAVFDISDDGERFSAFELTDEKQGERLDRAEAVSGEIRIADRAYLQPERMGRLLAAGADVIVRAPWNGARWLDHDGRGFNLIKALLDGKAAGVVDCPVWIGRDDGPPLSVRLVAVRKPPERIKETRARIEAEAKRKGRKVQIDTLIAAGWVILVTSLDKEAYPAADIGALYRLRWRIEIAFKHLKSGLGLKRPPGDDPGLAKVHVLCHLLMALLAEPHLADRVGVSPRRAAA